MQTSDPSQSLSEEQIFDAAAALPSSERTAYLEAACEGQPTVRAAVDQLLASLEDDAFMQRAADRTGGPEVEAELARFKPEAVGDQIGNYTLREQIGEGGFGTVWVAEQEKPVRRRVALKIIKLGMDTKEVIARFEQERQALAMMDDPNIAKVLDAGATSFGRPYFVMELVRGIKITKYCDQANLPTAARLKLFTAVCHAVQHAHQKGIIHRDLKPSNILVTLHDGVPVPKVIDFGVAKATQQQRLTDLTIYTQFEQMIGTPLYMSPEQAEMSGLDIDTRSDIYSLGVLLYELLVGHTPFDPETLMKSGFDEMRRVIREQEPQRPSTFVGTMSLDLRTDLAKHRQTDSAKLVGQIRGDLDWIVMKALEKDRSRRYETASGLAQDIQRHLENEPVQARPPTTLYRFRRMVRRNKVAFAAASAVLAALLIGLGVSMWMFFKERQTRERAVAAENAQREERKRAESEASKSRQVALFLKDMLAGVGPSAALGREMMLLNLDKTAERVGSDLKDQPEVEAELCSLIGEVYSSLGEYEKAEVMYTRALAMFKKGLGDEHKEVANSLNDLSIVLVRRGRLREAEAFARDALAMSQRLYGNEDDFVATAMGTLAGMLPMEDEAESLSRAALEMRRRMPGSGELVWQSVDNLARILRARGKRVEADALPQEALTIARARFGNEHPAVVDVLLHLAFSLRVGGKLADSEARYREALAMARKLFGTDDPKVADPLSCLGSMLRDRQELTEAESMAREAVRLQRKFLGGHPKLALSLYVLSSTLLLKGEVPEAENVAREALEIARNLPAVDPEILKRCLRTMGEILVTKGNLSEAKPLFLERLGIEMKPYGTGGGASYEETGWRLTRVIERNANFIEAHSGLKEATVFLDEQLALQKQILGNEHPAVAESLYILARFLEGKGDPSEVEALFREGLALQKHILGNEHPAVAESLHKHAHCLEGKGDPSEVEALFREGLQIKRKVVGPYDPSVAFDAVCLTRFLLASKKFAEAEPIARECLTILEKTRPDDWQTFNARSLLGGSLLGQKKYAEAEPLLLSGYEGLKQREDKISAANRARLEESLQRLVQLYEATGKPEQAADWQRKLDDFDKAEAKKLIEGPARPQGAK